MSSFDTKLQSYFRTTGCKSKKDKSQYLDNGNRLTWRSLPGFAPLWRWGWVCVTSARRGTPGWGWRATGTWWRDTGSAGRGIRWWDGRRSPPDPARRSAPSRRQTLPSALGGKHWGEEETQSMIRADLHEPHAPVRSSVRPLTSWSWRSCRVPARSTFGDWLGGPGARRVVFSWGPPRSSPPTRTRPLWTPLEMIPRQFRAVITGGNDNGGEKREKETAKPRHSWEIWTAAVWLLLETYAVFIKAQIVNYRKKKS